MASRHYLLKLLLFLSLLGSAVRASEPQQIAYSRNQPSLSKLTACKTTPYPQLCTHILLTSSTPTAPLNRQVAAVSSFALSITSSSYRLALHLARIPPPQSSSHSHAYSNAVQDCIDLMSNTMDQLRLSIQRLSDLNMAHSSVYSLRAQVMDAQVSLSASFTFQDTCLDELNQHNVPPAAAAQLLKQVGDTSRAVTVAMALADTLHHRVSP